MVDKKPFPGLGVFVRFQTLQAYPNGFKVNSHEDSNEVENGGDGCDGTETDVGDANIFSKQEKTLLP